MLRSSTAGSPFPKGIAFGFLRLICAFGVRGFYLAVFWTRRERALDDFGTCWEGLDDPRTGNARLHDFHELLTMALCPVLCGAQGAADRALFAKAEEPFLREA